MVFRSFGDIRYGVWRKTRQVIHDCICDSIYSYKRTADAFILTCLTFRFSFNAYMTFDYW